MRPSAPLDHIYDSAGRHAVLLAEILVPDTALCVAAPDLRDLPFSQDGVSTPFATGGTPLRSGVSEIVGLRPYEQVLWVDARWDITSMADNHSIGHLCAVSKFPRNAVRSASVDFAIAVVARRLTNPAAIVVNGHVAHETNMERRNPPDITPPHAASRTAILAAAIVDAALGSVEGRTAVQTSTLYRHSESPPSVTPRAVGAAPGYRSNYTAFSKKEAA